jgi:predicted  nucleic acid-binding Zn-ribbon protein
MRAEPAAQLRLLDLQAVDTGLDQLAHRRGTLPELAEIATLTASMAPLRDSVVRARTDVEDLARQIKTLEGDVEQVRNRAKRDEQRLTSGASSAKDLESLQHEVASLARRQSELEDIELELMEQQEAAQAALTEAERALTDAEKRLTEAETRRDAELAEIASVEAERRAEREPLAAQLPTDLLALYEKIRSTTGVGVGAARLRARTCEGCRIELSGSDLAAAKAAAEDEVLRCEECRRILVRTPESGL